MKTVAVLGATGFAGSNIVARLRDSGQYEIRACIHSTGKAWDLARLGIPLTIVTRHIKPEWLLKKVEASRLSVGVRAAYQPRTLPTIMKALRKGESVAFVIDQYTAPPSGLKVRFFGVEVDTLGAVGPLAQRTGAAVLPVLTYRDEQGIVHTCIEPELELGEAVNDQQKTTQILADKVESWIRAYPTQWLWVHRRFKNV